MATNTKGVSEMKTAFPTNELVRGNSVFPAQEGMTLRDYFAGQAMIALVKLSANQDVDDFTPNEVAKESYRYSDAMLKEREI